MSKQIDLTGVDEIINQSKKSEIDLTGVDEIKESTAGGSFLDNAYDYVTEGAKKGFQETLEDPLETAKAFSVGTAKGLSLGLMDEIGALESAKLETLLSYVPGTSAYETRKVDEELRAKGFDIPEESFMQKYRAYQKASEGEMEEISKKSPIADIGGQLFAARGLTKLIPTNITGPKELFSDVARNKGKAEAALALLTGTAKTGSKAIDVPMSFATNYAKAAPLIALESAASSSQNVLGEEGSIGGVGSNIPGVMEDVKGGLTFGAAALGGLTGVSEVAVPAVKSASKTVGKLGDFVSETMGSESYPNLRKIKKFFEMGEEGKPSPFSHKARIAQGPESFTEIEQQKAQKYVDTLLNARVSLGKEMEEALEKATVAGKTIDFDSNISSAVKRIINANLGMTPEGQSAYSKFLSTLSPAELKQMGLSDSDIATIKSVAGSMQSKLTPKEVKAILKDLDEIISSYKDSTVPADQMIFKNMTSARKAITNNLKQMIPEYKNSAERFEDLGGVFDQVVSGPIKSSVTDTFYGDISDKDKKLYISVLDMLKKISRTSEPSDEGKKSANNFINRLKAFELNEMGRLQRGVIKNPVLPSVESIRTQMISDSDELVGKASALQTSESRAVLPTLKQWAIGKPLVFAPYWAGRAKKVVTEVGKPVLDKTVDISKSLFGANNNELQQLADELQANPGFKTLGEALKESIESNNNFKKNAVLFTVMQNPNARLVWSSRKPSEEPEEYVTSKETVP